MPAVSEINQVGKREDLSDKLVVADAKNTPVTSMMPKGKKPAKTIFDWPVGGVPDPDTDSVPDGQPVDGIEDGSGNRALLHGRVHKLRRTVGVSEMAEEVSTPAGVQSEFAHGKANMLLAVKRAMEAVFCGDQDSSLTGTKHTTRGLGSWISNTAQSDLPVPAGYRTPAAAIYSGTLANLTEDDIRALFKAVYQATGENIDWDMPCGTDLKEHISKMTIHDDSVSTSRAVVRTFFTQLKDNVLTGVVDVIKGDFGTARLHPSLWLGWDNTAKLPNMKRGYGLNIKDLSMRANKLPGFKPLPDDDSGPRGVITAIIGMEVGTPLRHGKIAAT